MSDNTEKMPAPDATCESATQEAEASENVENKTQKRPIHRGVYLLPNMLTSFSMFMGFLCIIWSIQGRFEAAAIAIFVSAVMDGLDGKVARLTNTASEFGVQYDSLADLIAFGVAPAIMMWQWQLEAFARLGVAVAFLYAACGALRLARFNVSAGSISKRFFIGLPIPTAGCMAAAWFLFADFLKDFPSFVAWTTLIITFALALLMVSNVRYFSFKEYDFVHKRPYKVLVVVLSIFVLIYLQPRVSLFFIGMTYIIGGLFYTFYLLPRRNRTLLRVLSNTGE